MTSLHREHGDLPVFDLKTIIISQSEAIFNCLAANHNPEVKKELLRGYMAALLAGIRRYPGYSKVKAIQVSETHLILEDGTLTKAGILLPNGGRILKKSELEKIISS